MIKLAIKYIGYLMAFAGAVTLVWKVAVYFDRRDNRSSLIEIKVDKLIISDSSRSAKLDHIITNQKNIEIKFNESIVAQNALRNSYVLHLSKDKALTKEDFLKYMEGLSLELKKNDWINMWLIPLQKDSLTVQELKQRYPR